MLLTEVIHGVDTATLKLCPEVQSWIFQFGDYLYTTLKFILVLEDRDIGSVLNLQLADEDASIWLNQSYCVDMKGSAMSR